MTQGSSLPPIKKNDGKYALVALLLLLAAGALWWFVKSEDSEPSAEVAEPAPEPPPREQFAQPIEIPEQPAAAQPTEAPPQPKKQPGEATWTPPSEWDCRGTLEASQIRDVINGPPRKQVQTCYERSLKDNNLLQGTMKVLLTIGGSGEVRAVSIRGSLNDPQVYACVKRVAKTWKFPKPQGGCVRTEVPFQMTPKL